MAIVTSQRQASSEEIVAEMDRRGLVIQQLEELRDRLCDDIKTLRDDVEMEKRVREEWRQRCEWAEQRAEAAENLLRGWQSCGCPYCGGDCSSANPPVSLCLMRDTGDHLANLIKEPGHE